MDDKEREVLIIRDGICNEIRSRLKESVDWHRRYGSTASGRTLIDFAVKHEAQRWEKMAEEADKNDQNSLGDFYRAVKEDWLPSVAHELKAAAHA